MSGTDDDSWQVAGQRFQSRLIVGTGRYKDLEETAAAIEASGAEIVTVAVRRVNLSDPKAPMLQDYVSPKRYTYLPNTAGCHTAKDAVRTLRLAREAGGWNLVKLEVLGPAPFLYPDMPATFEAAEALIADGFQVMVYCADDPLAAKRLEDMGCVAIMPLASLIGSGMGILNPWNSGIIINDAKVPVIVDAGIGTASPASTPASIRQTCRAAVPFAVATAWPTPVIATTGMIATIVVRIMICPNVIFRRLRVAQ